jgi:hypothetical protein
LWGAINVVPSALAQGLDKASSPGSFQRAYQSLGGWPGSGLAAGHRHLQRGAPQSAHGKGSASEARRAFILNVDQMLNDSRKNISSSEVEGEAIQPKMRTVPPIPCERRRSGSRVFKPDSTGQRYNTDGAGSQWQAHYEGSTRHHAPFRIRRAFVPTCP